MPDERDLYPAQLGVFLNPRDPEVIAAAEQAGITLAWITAAQRSPIYKLAMEWQVALPLHPEYRTLPMVWYVPPLSPIMNHVENEPRLSAEGYFTALDEMRILMEYLASLLAAGDVEVVRRAMVRLVAMRIHMRKQTAGDIDDGEAWREAGMSAQDVDDMARLLGVAKYDERFVIPSGRREGDPNLNYEQGACSLEDLAPAEGVLQPRRRSSGSGGREKREGA